MANFDFCKHPVSVRAVSSKYRTIRTALPVPESLQLLEDLYRYESRSMHGQMPIIWDRAEGCTVGDPWGNRWIDFTSTIFVANVGHAHPHIIGRLQDLLNQKLLHTYTFPSEIRAQFLKKLIEVTPASLEKAYLVSAGTEATEAAVKLMRLYGQQTHAQRVGVIAFRGSMHGRTMGAEMLKGNEAGSSWIGFRDPNIHHIEFPAPWTVANPETCDWTAKFQEDIKRLFTHGVVKENLCGFILESYIGWGGMFFPKAYVQALARFAAENQLLLTFDEIQSGFGRTGQLFAYQHYEVEPDMICLGKGMSSSLPLAGVIGRREILDLPDIGSMSSTHSANPMSCAAGLANLEILQKENLVAEAQRKGILLHQRLLRLKEKYSQRIKYIFGKGLLAAVLVQDPKTGDADGSFASHVCEYAAQRGLLLVHTGRESIKLGPPLSIPDEALFEGLDVLEESIMDADRDMR